VRSQAELGNELKVRARRYVEQLGIQRRWRRERREFLGAAFSAGAIRGKCGINPNACNEREP
jgi:hypothetical protein